MEDQQSPFLFHTGSCSEWHNPSLYRYLYSYFSKNNMDEEAQTCSEVFTEPHIVSNLTKQREIIRNHQVLINAWYVNYVKSWFEDILKNTLEITDYWYRFEFAKSRGMVHFHSILFSKENSKKVNSCLNEAYNAKNKPELFESENTIAKHIIEELKKINIYLTALHPGGRERDPKCDTFTKMTAWLNKRITASKFWSEYLKDNEIGESEEGAKMLRLFKCIVGGNSDVDYTKVGNVDKWLIPEGFVPERQSAKALKRNLSKVMIISQIYCVQRMINYIC